MFLHIKCTRVTLFFLFAEIVTKMASLFQVLALKGSYHGDTLGAMEAQAPSSFTGFLQQPWYGLFIHECISL